MKRPESTDPSPVGNEQRKGRSWAGLVKVAGVAALAVTTLLATGCADEGQKLGGEVNFAPSSVFVHHSGTITSITEAEDLPDGKLGKDRVGIQVATVSPGNYKVVSPYQLTKNTPIQFGCINPHYGKIDDLNLSLTERNGTYGNDDFGYALALVEVEGVSCYEGRTNAAWINSSGSSALAVAAVQTAFTIAS